jgi:hypothetical protein
MCQECRLQAKSFLIFLLFHQTSGSGIENAKQMLSDSNFAQFAKTSNFNFSAGKR